MKTADYINTLIKENEKLSYKQLFKRTLFLPINTMFSSVTYCIIMLGCILVLPENLFTQLTSRFDKFLKRKYLKPGEEPSLKFGSDGDKMITRELCNIHGLWSNNYD